MKRSHAAAALFAAALVAGPGYLFLAPAAVAQPQAVTALQQRLDHTEARVATGRRALKAHEKAMSLGRAQARSRATDYERAQAAVLGAGEAATAAQTGHVAQTRSAWLAAQQSADDLTALVSSDRVRLGAAIADLAVMRRAAAGERARRPARGGDGAANPMALRAVDYALAQVGDPYVWAANGPDSWDCSGLTRGAYLSAGISLPRVSRQQFWAGPLVDRRDLLPGDLLFFAHDPSDPSTIHHVAMYIGAGLVVHAPQTGDVVRIAAVWTHGYAGAVRVLPAVSTEPGRPVPVRPPTPSPTPALTPTPQPSATPSTSPAPTPSTSPLASIPAIPVSPLGVTPLFSAAP